MLKPKGNLWHHRDFTRLWFSDTVSQFGNQFTQIALPLIAVSVLRASATQVAILIGLQTLSFPVLGMFVGVWADRMRKRRIMVTCNFGRMATLASIPLAFFLDHALFSIYLLFVVGLVNGIFTVFFDISYQAYLPFLIDKSDLIEGNQKLQISSSGAQLAGPSLAGFVYGIIGGPLSILADAFGYLASALSLSSIRKEEPKKEKSSKSGGAEATGSPSEEEEEEEGEGGGGGFLRGDASIETASRERDRPSFFREMREGARVVFDNPVLWTIAGTTGTSNLGTSIAAPALLYFILSATFLHFSSIFYGALNTVGSAGFFVGVLLTSHLTKKLGGVGRALAIAIAASLLGMADVLAPRDNVYLAFGLLASISFVSGVFLPVYNINQISLRQAIVPNRLQGRMNATMRTIVWGTIPLGAFIGGVLVHPEVLGITYTILLGYAIAGAAFAWIALGPVVKVKTQPKPLPEDTVEEAVRDKSPPPLRDTSAEEGRREIEERGMSEPPTG
jgi:MFS family permease